MGFLMSGWAFQTPSATSSVTLSSTPDHRPRMNPKAANKQSEWPPLLALKDLQLIRSGLCTLRCAKSLQLGNFFTVYEVLSLFIWDFGGFLRGCIMRCMPSRNWNPTIFSSLMHSCKTHATRY